MPQQAGKVPFYCPNYQADLSDRLMEALILVLFGAAVLYWFTSQQCKQLAITGARRECERHSVQLLDQTVQQTKLSMSRDHAGQWRFWREYRFDYSLDGINRHEGRLTMLGKRIIRSVLESFDPVIH